MKGRTSCRKPASIESRPCPRSAAFSESSSRSITADITVRIADGSVTGEMHRRALALVLETVASSWHGATRGLATCASRPTPQEDRSAGLRNMAYTVVYARYVRDFTIWLKFADGSEGDVDLAGELWGACLRATERCGLFSQLFNRRIRHDQLAQRRRPSPRVSLREGTRSRLTRPPGFERHQ